MTHRLHSVEAIACIATLSLRASAIIFDIRTGPPSELIRIGKPQDEKQLAKIDSVFSAWPSYQGISAIRISAASSYAGLSLLPRK